MASDELVVIANKATYQAAQKWVDFLATKGVPLKNVEPSQTDKFEKANYVVLMGGVDEPGIGDLVKKAVGDSEYASLQTKGAGKMFMRSGVWSPGQNIVVFAGSDQKAAEKARVDSKEEWLELFADWFGIELGGPSMHGY
jgi:hypothetical protein